MNRLLKIISFTLLAALLFAAALFAFHEYESRSVPDSGERAVAASAGTRPCPKLPPSKLATRYLENLHGIEIGASTQNSFDLKRSINVDFSDEQGGLWQDKACAPAVVNIVALGDNLPFKDNTLDYVLSSHVIEHFFDPIKALREWHRVIRPGGYIFVIAPHKDRTFDKARDVTPLRELLDRSSGKLKLSNYAKPVDYKAMEKAGKRKFGPSYEQLPHMLIRDGSRSRLEAGWTYYEADDHHHWSVWRTEDFVALIRHLKFTIVDVQDVDDKVGNGFTVVIRK